MHPYVHSMYGHHPCGRAFSRLFWFAFGAGVSAWWIKSNEIHNSSQSIHRMHWCARHQIPAQAYPAPSTVTAATGEEQEGQTSQGPQSFVHRWRENWRPAAPPTPKPVPAGLLEEKDRMNDLGRSVCSKEFKYLSFCSQCRFPSDLQVSEFSEMTLDALLTKIESLKAVRSPNVGRDRTR